MTTAERILKFFKKIKIERAIGAMTGDELRMTASQMYTQY
jgi:hypothetical protein